MRTTLTLDDDIAAELHKLCVSRKKKFKAVVNEALRAGIALLNERERPSGRRYRIKPVSLGKARLPELDNVAEVLAIAEGEGHR